MLAKSLASQTTGLTSEGIGLFVIPPEVSIKRDLTNITAKILPLHALCRSPPILLTAAVLVKEAETPYPCI